MEFFLEVLVGGLLAGTMYSVVAIGFVLIYKASGIFNFAQGALVLFGALTYVCLVERGLAPWFAILITLAVLVAIALLTGRLVLRPLVNRPPITLFMATLGLSLILEGAAQLIWGAQVHGLDLGIDDKPLHVGGVMVSQFDLFAAALAGVLVIGLSALTRYSRLGLKLRAVADDPLAALAVGVRLEQVWAIVWALAGFVSLVAGLLWGARLGVQFSLSLVVLKALPVLIIGGFSSITGAIVGGLLVGAGEKLAEVYLGALIGDGIENWFPYVIAMLFLLARPSGLFGEATVERI
ncbi:branched-chain amino acid ABC transporter permease [Paraburkholderia sp. MMS20-SJTR3]|uniref:Branched-chain amino acid ABC transporter permease n=1 Tax=Paraburkholderia sejongensis TaxID=2886946 RepID=A0ABS8JRG2_9BURK|nr:branched-chain amino acid ABC transporter permease [Paraburkholderia sp. MMS20-SJTR3]MCC8392491.1 branched-chain amino acid ABC transporter permease [Paraburkholderia sp. MMS20-SJTR3]